MGLESTVNAWCSVDLLCVRCERSDRVVYALLSPMNIVDAVNHQILPEFVCLLLKIKWNFNAVVCTQICNCS